MRKTLVILLFAGGMLVPAAARACPLCREAVSKSSDAGEDDQFREAQGYNNSIYLMIGMVENATGVSVVSLHHDISTVLSRDQEKMTPALA